MLNNISYKFRKKHFINFRIMPIIICIIVLSIAITCLPHFFRDTYTVVVTNKKVVSSKNGDKYFVYTQAEDGRIIVFRIANNLMELKFNSEDLYLAMAVHRKYEITAYGFNIPLLSCYQNIVKVKGLGYWIY